MESAVAADRAATHGGFPASVLVAGLAIAEKLGLRADEARLRLAQAIVMKRRGEPARAGADLERATALSNSAGG